MIDVHYLWEGEVGFIQIHRADIQYKFSHGNPVPQPALLGVGVIARGLRDLLYPEFEAIQGLLIVLSALDTALWAWVAPKRLRTASLMQVVDPRAAARIDRPVNVTV